MSNIATKLKAQYQIGASHRKQGKPIVTKAAFLASQLNWGETDHDLNLDLYTAYSKGYRATVPAMPLSVGISMGGVQ